MSYFKINIYDFNAWKNGAATIAIRDIKCGNYLRLLSDDSCGLAGEKIDYIICQKCGTCYTVTQASVDDPASDLNLACRIEVVEVFDMKLVSEIGGKSAYWKTFHLCDMDLIAYRKKHDIWLGNDPLQGF